MKKFTWHVDIGLIIVLVLLGLHCFALHKRIQYLEEELISMHRDRMAVVDGFNKYMDEISKKFAEMYKSKEGKQ